ncbi:deleted in malignant brain tumors 1 protein-like [Haemorhous mexicanus]|uniref:deleted in malignant brain tumors 1 protein-like n=1 Tax=Haemorhous mexicanus TaxID=30427 RepID=UPI0028BF2D46|nr:deleted in malignant brain tumors 1 protein-like [Haemorhous mexicanus]
MLLVGCGLKPVLAIRMALGRLQQQRWSPGACRKGPRRAGAVGGGLSPPGDIRVAAHCGEVCDGRGAGEAHIWARSRLLEAAAPQPGDEVPDKGCPGAAAAAACTGSGAGERWPGCAGWGPVAMGPLVALGLLVCVRLCGGSGQLRLVGGGGRCAGRVEVKHDGEWGSVCVFDFDWEARWAEVVCRQLGCGRVARASLHAPFGQGSGRIWLQPFFCNGNEDELEYCPHFGWGQHLCGHEQDVGVTCTDAVELRLSDGSNPCAGRVEVKLQGHWGSVADDNWDMEDAEVVCQQLGCGSASGASSAHEHFGLGDGLVSLALVDCSGDEATLWDCEIRGWGPYNVSINDFDTAVVCQGFSRLVGGDGGCAGRLEVRQSRAWVGVCEDEVDMKVAQVVCRELGCGEVVAIAGSGRFGAVSGSLWDGGFQCNGSEPLLSACVRRPPQSQGCTGPASVICSSYSGFRLGNGSSGCSGRVEVAVRGTWGSVCASEWDLADAHVLCRHLGCGRAFSVPAGGSFGSGEGPLRPHAFGCSGSERHLGECPVAVLGKPPCAPGNAAAVNCSGVGFVPSLRLVGGQSLCDGRLEETITSPAWRRVPLEQWKSWDVYMVCAVLGCGLPKDVYTALGSPPTSSSSPSEVDIMTEEMDSISGMGPAANSSLEEMVIVCSGSLQVRLVGSPGRCAGRVEVYSGGSWSSVCGEGWELQDAVVVCRELGCGTALEAPGWARFGAGTGPLWPYSPDCSGSEGSLWDCGRTERRECGSGGGAGAVCSEQLSVRLAEGPGRCAGFLEVSYNGTWGRVCINGTSNGTAAAVCRQLGCGDRGWLSGVPAQEPTDAWLAWVGCEDGAHSLWQCPSAPWHLQSCGTDGHVHVECEEHSDGITEGHTSPYAEGDTSTGVPSRTARAVAVGSVPVPTVLCVVLGTLLCLSLGALALLLCRARAQRRGPGRAADAISNAVYEELDYKAMPEYQEVPTPPGSLLEGWVKKLPSDSGDSVQGSDTEAAPDPPLLFPDAPAQPDQGTLDGYDDVLDVPQEPPDASTGDISEAVARQRWICVLPTGGIYSPPCHSGATGDPSEQIPEHMDYDDHPAVAGQAGHGPCLRHVVLREVADVEAGLQRPEGVQFVQQGLAESVRAQPGRGGGRRRGEGVGGGLAEVLREGQEGVGCEVAVREVPAGGNTAAHENSRETISEPSQGHPEVSVDPEISCPLWPGQQPPTHPASVLRFGWPVPPGPVWAPCGGRVCERSSPGQCPVPQCPAARRDGAGQFLPPPHSEGPGRGAGQEWLRCRWLGSSCSSSCSVCSAREPGTRVREVAIVCTTKGRGNRGPWQRGNQWSRSCEWVSEPSEQVDPCAGNALPESPVKGSGQLRLVGGGGRCAGRVEVKRDGEWGSVCFLGRDGEARWAEVVCRQLGCGRVARASSSAPFGQGSGRIWLQPFFCRGTEDELRNCSHFGWGRHFCGHQQDVGVICTDAVELRLSGGGNPCAGRVEVKLQGHWGSVADDSWDMKDAEVVCQQLGCGSASGAYFAVERFDVGDGLVSLALVDCSGDEATLWDCEIRGWGPYNSSINDLETAVVCQGFSRLVGGYGGCAGRLEVRQGQAWVGVCEDEVDMKVAQVVCRELGCGEVVAIASSGRFGAVSGSLWDGGFQCNGSEPLLSACARRPPQSQGCTGPASVICSSYTGFRLENGSSGCSGRVEVAVRGTWGSVCASEWDLADAHVLCRHLGCGRAFSVPAGGSFGSGEGPLRPDAFGCSGSERHLGECPVAVLGKPPCAPGNAAAVNCSGVGFVPSLRLVGGQSLCDGRLEETITSPAWRRVPLEQWKSWDVYMVCAVLGCGHPKDVYTALGSPPASSSSPSEVDIMTEEMDSISGMGPAANSSLEEMVIVCSGSLQVRLVGSPGRCAGRVEVYSGGSWSSVCGEGWELQDAAVVCRELGCGTALEAPGWARFGAGTGPLWPYSPDCSGSEGSLWDCGRTERRECGSGGGAGAVCSEQLSVRLAEGPGRCAGFLEVSYNGTWGRVCANGNSPGTAAAVCRQLGCGDRGQLSAVPAQEPTDAWLAWVGCEDGARSLWQCPSAPWHLQSCSPGEHVHVECEEHSDGTTEGHTSPYAEGGTSTGVPSRTALAVAVASVPVPTVLCVVLGTLLCLSLGALALLLCRARAQRRGPGRAADAISNAVYEELDYKAMPEYQEVPTPPGSLLEGWVKKLPSDSGDSVEGSDTEAAPDPPAQPDQGTLDGYDDVLDVPQEPPDASTGDISEAVAQQRWICVLPTGGIYSPPCHPGTNGDPSERIPEHMDYDDVGSSTLGTLP